MKKFIEMNWNNFFSVIRTTAWALVFLLLPYASYLTIMAQQEQHTHTFFLAAPRIAVGCCSFRLARVCISALNGCVVCARASGQLFCAHTPVFNWMRKTFTLAPSRVHILTVRLARDARKRPCLYDGASVAFAPSFGTHVKVVMLKWREVVRIGWENSPVMQQITIIFSCLILLKIVRWKSLKNGRSTSTGQYHTQWYNSATCTTLTPFGSVEWRGGKGAAALAASWLRKWARL